MASNSRLSEATSLPYSLPENIRFPLKNFLHCLVSLPGLEQCILHAPESTYRKLLLKNELKSIIDYVKSGTGNLTIPTILNDLYDQTLESIISYIFEVFEIRWQFTAKKTVYCDICGRFQLSDNVSILYVADYCSASDAANGFFQKNLGPCPTCENLTSATYFMRGSLPCFLVMALPLGSRGRIDIDDFNVTGNCDTNFPGVGLYKHVATIAEDAGGHWAQCFNFNSLWRKCWILYRGSQVIPGEELTKITFENYCFLFYVHSGFYSDKARVTKQV